MKNSAGKNIELFDTLLPDLARTVFLSDNYAGALQETLRLLCQMLEADYAECRTKTAGDTTWHIACSYNSGDDIETKDNLQNRNGGSEFYKPSLEVVDEVWLTDISETRDPLFPERLKKSDLLFALCIHIAFGNGRNDFFRFLFTEDVSQQNYQRNLNEFLPELKKLLKKKHSNELINRSEQKYRTLFDEDLTPNFILAPDGAITNCNQAFIHLFGFKNRKAALQSNFNDRFTNFMHQVYFWEALQQGEEINNYEMPASKLNGENVQIILKVVAEYDENQELTDIVGYIQDITNRKEAEAALRKSEERYRTLIETTNDWIWEIDDEYCFTYSSLKIHSILGYDLNHVMGESIFELMPANIQQNAEKKFKSFTHHQKAFINEELSFINASGEIAIFETSGIPLFTNNGIFQGYRGIAKDITERKRTEKQIARLNDELEYKVIERTKMLQIANKELEAFSYSVSHDLRAPLRSIDGFSQALIEDYSDVLDETGKNYLNRVRSAAQRMSTLIDDMIKLAKVSRSTIEKKELNLSEMASGIANALIETDPDRNVEFIIQPDITAVGDKNLIKVVLQNLMENAWKFTSKNKHAKIEVGIEDKSGNTTYYVRDNGAGFNMDYARKLFTPFQRLHKESDFPGTGIGLSTVQRIIHRHLGKIWAEGKINSGAVFYFTLQPHNSE